MPPLDTGVRGPRMAVQEYRRAEPAFAYGLHGRRAVITRVPVYRWALPGDLSEIRVTVEAPEERAFDVVLFLTGTQAAHLCRSPSRWGARPSSPIAYVAWWSSP